MNRTTALMLSMALLSTLLISAGAQSNVSASPSNAKYVTILSPYNYTVHQNDTINIGYVGPGQTIYVSISSVTSNGVFTFDHGWNELDANHLPTGWIAQNSSLNNELLSTKITVAPNSPNGTYSFGLTAVNLANYSKLGNLSFRIEVNVTPNVFSFSASPSVIHAGPGQPASILVTLNNTGVSDSPFVISVAGLPAWNTTQTVIALHHSTGRVQYPIYENEPGVYHIKLYVNSTSSSLISKKSDLTLVVGASVRNDYAALGQGSIIFPIVYAPVYSIMYIIDLIAKAL